MYKDIVGYCLRDDDERACFVLGGIASSGGLTVYARKAYMPEDRWYQSRRGTYLEIDPDYLARLLNDFVSTL